MRRSAGAMLFAAALAAACSGRSNTPTAPSSTQSPTPTGAVSAQSNNNSAEVKGTVGALPPATPAGTFTAAGKTIVTNASTVFVSGATTKSFADLKVGVDVEVRGTASGNTITATQVEIENENEPEPEPEPNPPAPNPPAPNPPAPNPPNPPAPNPPAPAPPPDDDENEAEVRGTLGPITGACPAISSSVGTTKFTTSASTRFDVACTALRAGSKIEVRGTRTVDGSITATRVKKD